MSMRVADLVAATPPGDDSFLLVGVLNKQLAYIMRRYPIFDCYLYISYAVSLSLSPSLLLLLFSILLTPFLTAKPKEFEELRNQTKLVCALEHLR